MGTPGIHDKELVKKISDITIQKQFNTEVAHPNILTRDYARGIIEYANILGDIIDNIEKYRPPFKSRWPLENPLPSEIDKIDSENSNIRHSVQSYFSDFGKYVMKNAEYWTATPLSEKIAKNGKDLQYQFANTLPENLKLRYIQNLDRKVRQENINNSFDLESFLANDILETGKETVDEDVPESNNLVYDSEDEDLDFMPPMIEKDEEKLISEIRSKLGEAEQEYFRWVRKTGVSDCPAVFSHRWACRWVIKRAYDLGWTKELFGNFENMYCRNHYGLNKGIVERIGKKYQWIAYYELLARLADNLIFKDRGYSDVDDSRFYGPWQIDIREMDPSYWSKAKHEIYYDDINIHWWRPYHFELELSELDEQIKWLWDTSNLPDLKSIICVANDKTIEDWLILHSMCDWTSKPIKEDGVIGEPNLWYRVNTCIVKTESLAILKSTLHNHSLCSPDIIHIPNSDSQRLVGEYPWHPCYNFLREWIVPEEWDMLKIPCEYHVPLFEYNWSTSSFSHMPDESTVFFMPSKKIVNELDLHRDINYPSHWFQNDRLIFVDPGLEYNTQPCALINKKVFCKWLSENGYALVWLIGGEKQLFTRHADKFFGRQVYSGLYSIDGTGNIIGESWSENELPNSNPLL